jgi:hypothetical protein
VTELCEVVITAPDPDCLLDLTCELVAEGLCASVHNFSPVRSVYRWSGEIFERTEGRTSLHTRMSLVLQQRPGIPVVAMPGMPVLAGRPRTPADGRFSAETAIFVSDMPRFAGPPSSMGVVNVK